MEQHLCPCGADQVDNITHYVFYCLICSEIRGETLMIDKFKESDAEQLIYLVDVIPSVSSQVTTVCSTLFKTQKKNSSGSA